MGFSHCAATCCDQRICLLAALPTKLQDSCHLVALLWTLLLLRSRTTETALRHPNQRSQNRLARRQAPALRATGEAPSLRAPNGRGAEGIPSQLVSFEPRPLPHLLTSKGDVVPLEKAPFFGPLWPFGPFFGAWIPTPPGPLRVGFLWFTKQGCCSSKSGPGGKWEVGGAQVSGGRIASSMFGGHRCKIIQSYKELKLMIGWNNRPSSHSSRHSMRSRLQLWE